MKKAWIILVCVAGIGIYAKDMSDFINKKSAQEIYGSINRYSIAAFSTDKLIKDGLAHDTLTDWNTIIRAANKFVMDTEDQYISDIVTLAEAQEFIVSKVAELHEKYGEAFASFDAKNKKWTIDVNKIKRADKNISYLQKIRNEAQNYWKKINALIEKLLSPVFEDEEYPAEWIKSVPKDPSQIYPNYKELYADWVIALKKTNNRMTENEFNLFMRQHNVKDAQSARLLVDKLEKLQYRLDQQGGKIFARQQKKMAADFKEIIKRLKKLYPDMPLSMLSVQRILKLEDKPMMIMFAEADALQGPLKRMIFEIDALMQALQK